jgi:hypothetical protein
MFDGSDISEDAKAAIVEAATLAINHLAEHRPQVDGRAQIQAALMIIGIALEPYGADVRAEWLRMVAAAVLTMPRHAGARLELVKR